MIISVTGKSGSGKSHVAKSLSKKLDFVYVDIDQIGHSIYKDAELRKKLVELFGTIILNEDGTIDRKKIGKIIFSNPNSKLREQFNQLTWQPMKKQIDALCKNNDVVLDWINLPFVEYWEQSAIKVLVYADIEKRFNVLAHRDNLDRDGLKLREQGSPDYSNCQFDYTYKNSYKNSKTKQFVEIICQDAKLAKYKEQEL